MELLVSSHEGHVVAAPALVAAATSRRDEQEAAGALEEDVAAEEQQQEGAAERILVETTLRDRSRYYGQSSADPGQQPQGLGVLYSALGTHSFAGAFDCGAKSGLGVKLLPNGTLYAGGFQRDDPFGDGVKRDPFGNLYVGRWREGELDGVALSVDADGAANWGKFQLNELVHGGASATHWRDAHSSLLCALLAEQQALQVQEKARELELETLRQGFASIGATPLASQEDIAQFVSDQDNELQLFLEASQAELQHVEREADRWKFQEAQLKEKQKALRRQITDARCQVAYTSKYVAFAEQRAAQVADAERTLETLLTQIDALQAEQIE